MGRGGGHPSMSQLKRWCFTSMSCTPSFSGCFSFSCRTTQRAGSVHHTQRWGGCVCRQSPCSVLPTSAQLERGEALRFGEHRGREGPTISLCPSWAGAGSTLCQHGHAAPTPGLPRQGKRPHPQPPVPAPEEAEDGLEHKAGRGRQ